jgi:RNA polymerase sigma-70 factor (ECF subfamily)
VALAEALKPHEETTETADETREEDARFVERFRRGDARAFDELVKRYQRQVFYLALRYVKNDDDAKDITQRAFVRAFQGVSGLRGDASFRTWLFKIAVNLALNHVRDRRKLRPVEEAAEVGIDAVGASRIDEEQDRQSVLDALDGLPPKQRLVLELRVFEELPFREVAVAAGCSENAAKVNFHHAVSKLKALVKGAAGIRSKKS